MLFFETYFTHMGVLALAPNILFHYLRPLPLFACETAGVPTDTAMSQEDIERAMEDAGWRVDSGFASHLIIGYDGHLSILAPRYVWELDESVFELYDEQQDVTYWVPQIPTPEQATELLEEHGGPPEEQRGNPYCDAGGNGEEEDDRRET